ncbi:MAG: hypothetical protein KatS3mg087_1417 [Patescibacteria group bacterium]|nr:MAG: hypothetical protein KatS3mg087_1417 [Patescibacteria group bacterium]
MYVVNVLNLHNHEMTTYGPFDTLNEADTMMDQMNIHSNEDRKVWYCEVTKPTIKHKTPALLQAIADEYGEDWVERAVMDSVSPGVCRICLAVNAEIEPDARNGYCYECESNQVVSGLVLMGLI